MERYFGRYRLSSLTHHPTGSCVARMSAAQPVLAIAAFAARTSASSSGLPRSWVSARYRTAGWSSSRSQSRGVFGFMSPALSGAVFHPLVGEADSSRGSVNPSP